MAIVRCDECDTFVDDDYDPCEESPKTGELICTGCMENNYDEDGNEVEC